jgi:3-oxoadipate enol-lactonase
MASSLVPVSTGHTRSADGSRIAWQHFGDGPMVVVANGIGVSWRGMAPQIAHLVERGHSVLTWDYRGLFDSKELGDGGLAVPAHARDGLAAMDVAGGAHAVWVGWSMGVNVAFEAAVQALDRVAGLFTIGGVPWSPFRAFAGRGTHRLLRVGSRAMVPLAPLASPVVRRTLPTDLFFRASKGVRYIRDTTDREAFQAMAADVASHDHRVYLSTLADLGRHDLRGKLGGLKVPVMMLVGGKDFLIRPKAVQAVAREIPGAEVRVVADTSHFMHLEDVAAVNGHLDAFLAGLPEG